MQSKFKHANCTVVGGADSRSFALGEMGQSCLPAAAKLPAEDSLKAAQTNGCNRPLCPMWSASWAIRAACSHNLHAVPERVTIF